MSRTWIQPPDRLFPVAARGMYFGARQVTGDLLDGALRRVAPLFLTQTDCAATAVAVTNIENKGSKTTRKKALLILNYFRGFSD